MPKISVVIPSYNHALYIGSAIQSVLTQSLNDLELIVVDDGSSDDSVKIIQSIQDTRIRLVVQENRGAHAAINRGLEMSTGEFCAILNSDDRYHPTRLEKLSKLLDAEPEIGLSGSYIEIIDPQGKVTGVKQGYQNMEPWLLPNPKRSFRAGNDLHAALLTENYLATTSNFVFRRELCQTIGGFRPLRYTHDWDFALRAARQSRIELVPEALLQYRIHPTNTIRENRAAMIFEICWCLAVHLPQYIADQNWFEMVSTEIRSEQLLNSIYTFGNENVLNVLLLHNLYRNEIYALSLLNLNNGVRQKLIESIKEKEIVNGAGHLVNYFDRVLSLFSKLKQLLRRVDT